ncbi:MAG: hypothetical protein HOE90_02340 [Bacteriovoracaceae bacterium]|jgi:hypothetical protein|nr:hypothetical protein [Bacteriovoracaceae bacterium]
MLRYTRTASFLALFSLILSGCFSGGDSDNQLIDEIQSAKKAAQKPLPPKVIVKPKALDKVVSAQFFHDVPGLKLKMNKTSKSALDGFTILDSIKKENIASDLKYIGHLNLNSNLRFVIFSGNSCTNCKNPQKLYIFDFISEEILTFPAPGVKTHHKLHVWGGRCSPDLRFHFLFWKDDQSEATIVNIKKGGVKEETSVSFGKKELESFKHHISANQCFPITVEHTM